MQLKSDRHGDTLIEVMLSIAIFAMVAMVTINLMNDGLNTAQRTLEAEMARNEIDAQAEALRFIHNNYVSEREKSDSYSQFRKAWNKITSKVMTPNQTVDNTDALISGGGNAFDINNMSECANAYQSTNGHLAKYGAFVLNSRLLLPDMSKGNSSFSYLGQKYDTILSHMVVDYKSDSSKFKPSPVYPRIIYQQLNSSSTGNTDTANIDEDGNLYNDILEAQGIWINAVGNNSNKATVKRSDYYDFYIRVCWQGAGGRAPSTITTVVRLYNPEVIE